MAVSLLYSSRARAEQLIATARVVLAAFSLLAIWLDPTTTIKHAYTAYTLLAAYLGYSVLLAFGVWRAIAATERLSVFVHAVDILVFSLLMYLTEGIASPFFVYFVFSVIAAALRWQWRGALWSAAVVLVIFLGMGFYIHYILRETEIDLQRFIIRSAHLSVVAVLLAYVTAFEQRLRREMLRLAAWPRGVPEDLEDLIRRDLHHLRTVYGAPRILMIWEHAEEPWVYVAQDFHDRFQLEREPPGTFHPWIAEPLREAHFLCTSLEAETVNVSHTSPAGPKHWRGVPVNPDLKLRLGTRSVLSLNLATEKIHGRIFVLDKRAGTTDLLTLSEVVARLVEIDLDDTAEQSRKREAAVAQERLVLARNLHDGLLQSLTAMALQAESANRLLESDPREARVHLGNVKELLLTEQRDLRTFVQDMRRDGALSPETEVDLRALLEGFVARMSRQWPIRVDLTLDHTIGPACSKLAYEAYRICQAALVNAAQHANASRVEVHLSATKDHLHIAVVDDGHGFPFLGRFSLAELSIMKVGPESIKQRVSALRGQLLLESKESGARLDILLPLKSLPSPGLRDGRDANGQWPDAAF